MQFLFRLRNFSWNFRFIFPLPVGVLSFFPNIEVFKVEVFLLSLWSGVVFSLGFSSLSDLIIYGTALVTRVFSSSPSAECFLAPWNRTRPAPSKRAVDQVDFMALACSCITLHEFISCIDPCRAHTGYFFVFCLHPLPRVLWPGSTLFYMLTCQTGGVLRICFGVFSSPCVRKISSAFSRCLQNSTSSLSPCVAESNPCMICCFGHCFRNDNSTSLSMSLSGRHFQTLLDVLHNLVYLAYEIPDLCVRSLI